MSRDSFLFFRSYYEAIEELPQKEQLKLYKAITNYALNNIEDETLAKTSRTIFQVIKPFLKEKGKTVKSGQDKPSEPLAEIEGIEFVKLTQSQYANLLDKYGENLFTKAVHVLDSWLARGGKTAKNYLNNESHYNFFRIDSWVICRAKEEVAKSQPNWSI